MKVEWISTRYEWERLKDEWDALAERAQDPFSRHAWLSAWWDCFTPPGPMETCVVRDRGGALVAALPAWRDDGVLRGVNDTEVWLGSRPRASSPAAMTMLAEALVEAGATNLAVNGMPVEDPAVKTFMTALERRGNRLRLTPYRRSPIIDTTGDFAQWRAQTRPRWRTDIERLRRKMERDHEVEISILERPGDLDAQLDAGWAVEARGWKGDEGTAIASSPTTEAFYRRVAHAFAERDELRLSSIVLDGELIAFDFMLVSHRRLWGLKTGFDPAHRRLAPGFVMRLAMIERCFESEIDAIDMLGDADEWKMRFATGTREHAVVEACPRLSATALSWTARERATPVARATKRGLVLGRLPQPVHDFAFVALTQI
jgi:CelD/BcsL family acetyltransferase involved in cellulose biosynthesis